MVAIPTLLSLLLTSTFIASAPSSATTEVQDPPPGNGRRIRPYGRPDLCVMVGNGYAAYGTAVNIAYCQSNEATWAPLQLWNVTNDSSGPIPLQSKIGDMCLSAGDNPVSGSSLTIDHCGNGQKQTWNYSAQNKIQLDSTDLCLDVKEGSGPINQNPYVIVKELQVWECTDDNNNQIFFELPYPNT
ncbi:hypothetical protein I309_00294 [Cryptococcus deuterogattii LA55]|nr:hypothetical protein I309_00294 [Cryptococcus deuterogattii LA55]KIR35592.1 hypothetical protein I352_01868 [Cryptococcus deuterogattii MMRL2647]KIR94967.1 hypothetical protein I304_01292 [Cryptococcus deuterogattii CBS 10090]